MKSAHRHQLETNVLADWLGKQLGGLEEYKNVIAVGALGVLVLAVIAVFAFSGENAESAMEWNRFFNAFSTRDPGPSLEHIVDKGTPEAVPTLWAKKVLADQELAAGCRLLFGNRKEASDKIERAEGLYTQVANSNHSDPMLKTSARIGQARALESRDKIEDARKILQSVAADNIDPALTKVAKEGLKRLEDPREVAMANWFTTQTPKLPSGHPPLGGLPGLDGPLPDRPNLSFPGGTLNNDGSTKTPSTDIPLPPLPAPLGPPKETTPPGEGTPPAELTPSATEPPASGSKPVEPAPAPATPESK